MPAPPDRLEDERHDLERLRREIESIDRDLIHLIARRVRLARKVGIVKHATGLPAIDPIREADVLRRASEVARGEGAPEADVRYLFQYLIDMSRRAQHIDD